MLWRYATNSHIRSFVIIRPKPFSSKFLYLSYIRQGSKEALNIPDFTSPSKADNTVVPVNKADVEYNIYIEYCSQINYDNKLLNRIDLFSESSKYFGLYKAIDLSQQLSSTLVTEILVSQDPELLLAGLISVDN